MIVLIYISTDAADDASIGYSLLLRGDVSEASVYIDRAWERDSSEALHRFLKARMLADAKAAAVLYMGVAEDTDAPDSLRAHAFFMLGSHCMVSGDEGGARDYYSRAAERQAVFRRSDRLAQDLLVLDLTEKAAGIWKRMLAGTDSIPACIGLGKVALKNGQPTRALEWFTRALVHAGEENRYRALLGAYEASCYAEAKTRASTYRKRIRREYPDGIVSLDDCGSGEDAGGLSGDDAISNNGNGKTYTLQVGAFGVRENARGLRDRLSELLSDIRIVEVKQGSVTLHKVHVGRFSSEQQALAFGEKKLRHRGIHFRVIAQ